jgi:hypothetical protein
VTGLIARLFVALNPRELIKYVLLFIFLWIVLTGVNQETAGADFDLLMSSVLLGLAAGWLISRIPLPAYAAGFASAALAVESALALVGRLDLTLGDILNSSFSILGGVVADQPPRVDSLVMLFDALERLIQTPAGESIRLHTWLVYVTNGISAFDPVASALVWSLIFHLCAVFAGWVVGARRQVLPAVLPGLACLSTVVVYSRGEWGYVLGALAVLLVLIIYMEFDRCEESWIRRRLPYAVDLRMDLMFASVLLIPGLLTAAALIPAVNLGEVTQWVRDQFSRASEGAMAGPESLGVAPGAYPGGSNIPAGMPSSHLLRGGFELTNQVMLVVVTGEAPTFLSGSSLPVPIRHYWRGESFDVYTGRGWTSSPVTEEQHAAGDRLTDVPEQGRVLHQEITLSREESGTLFLAGDLLTMNQPFQILLRSERDVFGGMTSARKYEVDSVIPDATERQLREAGSVYPDWIRRRYLQLPAALPDRVSTLAINLTASAVTPFDQALAIQEYLRRQYTYSLDITAAPPGRDVVDYFLFDSRTGYCDYYASAMVVLARAAGIPARLASGYGPGSFNLDQLQFVVVEADAHSWPEVYFPDIGWVEFEPTSSMQTIRRPESETAAPIADFFPGDSSEGEASRAVLGSAVRLLMLVPVAVLAGILGWLLWILFSPVLVFLQPAPAALRLQYRALAAHARRLQLSISASTTPRECAFLLAEYSGPAISASESELIARVAEEYAQMQYGDHPPAAGERAGSRGGWWKLELALRRLWLGRILGLKIHPRQ